MRGESLFLGLFAIGIVLIMLFPVSPVVLDLLLSFSLFFSIVALLLTLYVENPREITSFPSLLLFLTAFRLALSIASTRLILSQGISGKIITCFGEVVTEGSLAIGFILFALLTVVNFFVITKGAGRVAEVAARFALEALPGKQMAIDRDLEQKLITADQAKKGRKELQQEADFFGAMDGASKFVKGDAMAAIIILFVNLIGGFIVGMAIQGREIEECLTLFTTLTIGDSLVHQIPALLVSLGAGLLITRPTEESLGKRLPNEFFRSSKVLLMGAISMALLALLPKMPHLLLLFFALAMGTLAAFIQKKNKKEEKGEKREQTILPLALRLGVKWLSSAEEWARWMGEMRNEIARELGITLPSFTVSDDLALGQRQFALEFRGKRIFVGEAETKERMAERLKMHLIENGSLFVTRELMAQKLKEAKTLDGPLVDEICEKKGILALLSKVSSRLLKEGIPICDFLAIVEGVADQLVINEKMDPDLIAEKVRKKLAFHIVERFKKERKTLAAITFDPRVEEFIAHGLRGDEGELRPKTLSKIHEALNSLLRKAEDQKSRPIILAAEKTRLQLRRLVEREQPHLPVLSFSEIDLKVTAIQTLGCVTEDVLF